MTSNKQPFRFKRPRITLFQVLMLFALVASLLAWIQIEESIEDVVWTRHPLAYQIPDVPDQFQKAGECYDIPGGGMIHVPTFPNGSALYLFYHFRGWNWERYKFFDNEANQGTRWTPPDLRIDAKEHWGSQVHNIAIQSGAFQCQEQISDLLSIYPEDELRQKIAFPKRWLRVLIIVIGTLALGGLLWKPLVLRNA